MRPPRYLKRRQWPNFLELKSTAMNQRQESWHVLITDNLYLITLLLQLIAEMPL
jgi:hypothetical protein